MRTLSIVIPAYNEEAFIGTLLDRIVHIDTEVLGFRKEIIVVDDGSRDRTAAIASACPGVLVIRQANRGKGAAVQTGIRRASGDYVLVQDSDLEYDPADYLLLLGALAGRDRAAVYGSRILGQLGAGRRFGRHPEQGFGPWAAGILLSAWTLLLYQRRITDTLTAYKLYPTAFLRDIVVKTCGFETDHELTAKLARRGYDIIEVPIAYHPRSVEEGKKIRAIDGLIAVWTLLRFRFVD